MGLVLLGRGAGLRALVDQLEGFDDRADNMRPAFEAVAEDFRDLERARFRTAAGWAPVSPEWAARKATEGRPRRPLTYTGQLAESFTQRRDRYHVEQVGRDELVVKSKSPLLNLVTGANRGRGHGKDRELVKLTAADRRRWVRIVNRYLIGGRLP